MEDDEKRRRKIGGQVTDKLLECLHPAARRPDYNNVGLGHDSVA